MIDASNIQVTGTNFPAGNDVTMNFKGVIVTCTLNSATQVDCMFPIGVPAADVAVSPTLTFKDPVTMIELTTGSTATPITNPLSIGGGGFVVPTECSFAGGCEFSVTSNGLAGAMQGNSEQNTVTVCGQRCELDIAASSATQMTCTLPPVITTYSAITFDMVEASELAVTWTGTGADLMKLNDGINTKDSVDATATNCYAEVSAKPGYTFQLDSVKIFLTNLLDKTPYTDGNLVLQGSNDGGVTFTDIHSYDDSIHEGMNSVDWKAPVVSQVYKVIRLQGAIDGSCRIGEVKLIGVEVMDDNNASISCDAEANIDGVVSSLNSVTYSDAKTPFLGKMGVNPRFGSVLGGETLTLTGQGFAAGVATVKIDGRDCAVSTKTDIEIVCTTSDKPYVPGQTPSLDILIAGMGKVATAGQVYRYVSRWSDTETWGGDLPPLEGEAVEIPKG